ncbi:hypothetical protein JXQ70_16220 [bacterium]|nr:hypothetical protein [bacterium]
MVQATGRKQAGEHAVQVGLPLNQAARQNVLIAILVSMLVMIVAGIFLLNALIENGEACFPLDDSWIHLTLARNLSEQLRFAYVKDGPSIQASTSPLFTFLLTPAFIFSFNEYWTSYFWGVCGVLILVWSFSFCLIRFRPVLPGWTVWASCMALMSIALDRRVIWLSVSGMETTCFLAVVFSARTLLADDRYKVHALAVALIACWLRPEGCVFAVLITAVLIYDYLSRPYQENQVCKPLHFFQPGRRFQKIILGCGFIALLAYFGLNMANNGSLWPSTLAAKVTGFQAIGTSSYFIQVLEYLSYAGILLLLPGCVWAFFESGLRLKRKQRVPVLLDLLWLGTLIMLYYWKLPYVRQHGRYILPVLPFLVLIGLYGSTNLIARFCGHKNKTQAVLLHALLALITIWQLSRLPVGMTMYAQQCSYYLGRHVAAAQWLQKQTPPDAITGTHDIGAMGFLADRRLVDMAGLIDPEIVPHLHDHEYMKQWLFKGGVDYVAVLNTWYTVINVNPLAVFAPDPGEALSIFPLVPGLKFMQQGLIDLYFEAATLIRQRKLEPALQVIDQMLSYEPQFAAGYSLKATILIMLTRLDEAENALKQALHYQSDYAEAEYQYALLELQRDNRVAARAHLDHALESNPDHWAAVELSSKLHKDASSQEQSLTTPSELTD